MTSREAYIRVHGAPPDGFEVHHLCGHSDCKNVRHLIALSSHDHGKMHSFLCHLDRTALVLVSSRETDCEAIDPYERQTG